MNTTPDEVTGGVDVVVPFYNEEGVLPTLYKQLSEQTDDQGGELPPGFFRVIAVNNASTDNSEEILRSVSSKTDSPEVIIIDELEKGVVQARKTGSEFACKSGDRYPWLLHIDADNDLPPTLLFDVAQRFSKDQADVLAYSGHFSLDFWQRVPRLAERYYRSIGAIEFCPRTRQYFGFDDQQALFTGQLFQDFVRVPNQLGLAVKKPAFQKAGGYFREYDSNGDEILGEARNIWHRLDSHAARLEFVSEPFITLNPRRLLGDPERWCGGQSYAGGMRDIRGDGGNDSYALLNRLAETVDFSNVRRNLIKRFIIEPCVVNRQRITANPDYFAGFQESFSRGIAEYVQHKSIKNYADALPLILRLTEQYSDKILQNMKTIRQWNNDELRTGS